MGEVVSSSLVSAVSEQKNSVRHMRAIREVQKLFISAALHKHWRTILDNIRAKRSHRALAVPPAGGVNLIILIIPLMTTLPTPRDLQVHRPFETELLITQRKIRVAE